MFWKAKGLRLKQASCSSRLPLGVCVCGQEGCASLIQVKEILATAFAIRVTRAGEESVR